jgi:alkanesulfonate monooxygenase SsuD/methylene tetrahydromethanopterin reductase-like flavin-dependent oxidoreductase (luciferase family)
MSTSQPTISSDAAVTSGHASQLCTVGIMAPSVFAAESVVLDDLMWLADFVERSVASHIWIGDHLVWRRPILDAMTTLGVLLAATSTVRIGTNVLQLPLHGPLQIAKAFSSLAYLSEGRVDLGLGVGGDYPTEWVCAGVDRLQRGALMDDGLAVIDSMINGTPYAGKFYTWPEDALLAPGDLGTVPIWIAGRGDRAVERAARAGGYLGFMISPSRYRTVADTLYARSPLGVRAGMHMMVRIHDGSIAAQTELSELLANSYGMDPSYVLKYIPNGDPRDIIQFCKAYVAAGANHLSLYPIGRGYREQVEWLSEQVLPELVSM